MLQFLLQPSSPLLHVVVFAPAVLGGVQVEAGPCSEVPRVVLRGDFGVPPRRRVGHHHRDAQLGEVAETWEAFGECKCGDVSGITIAMDCQFEEIAEGATMMILEETTIVLLGSKLSRAGRRARNQKENQTSEGKNQ